MELAVKNMVCRRCIIAVEDILDHLLIMHTDVRLGTIVLAENISSVALSKVGDALSNIGFELIEDPKEQIVQKIKSLLIEKLEIPLTNTFKVSSYLSTSLNQSYSALSALFSEREQTTIEKYFIQLKIEKVKEHLSYNTASLKEIAYLLNYSSTAHLSKQFKEVTGISPTEFKNKSTPDRVFLDDI